jgi:hypothetical protein
VGNRKDHFILAMVACGQLQEWHWMATSREQLWDVGWGAGIFPCLAQCYRAQLVQHSDCFFIVLVFHWVVVAFKFECFLLWELSSFPPKRWVNECSMKSLNYRIRKIFNSYSYIFGWLSESHRDILIQDYIL